MTGTKKTPAQMSVVFSTYQSIDAVSQAQKSGLPEFDLIICDEAHRTTGVTLSGEDESHFVKVHDAAFLKARKRLYMTATPRIYSDDTKGKAKDADAELCSMDDATIFGAEFHRLGFGEAVSKGLLSDYQVLVLAVDEKYVSKTFQRQIADANNELNLQDAVKITGCWNGLAKRLDQSTAPETDARRQRAMRRAVAFSRSINDSKGFTQKFAQIISAYRETSPLRGRPCRPVPGLRSWWNNNTSIGPRIFARGKKAHLQLRSRHLRRTSIGPRIFVRGKHVIQQANADEGAYFNWATDFCPWKGIGARSLAAMIGGTSIGPRIFVRGKKNIEKG